MSYILTGSVLYKLVVYSFSRPAFICGMNVYNSPVASMSEAVSMPIQFMSPVHAGLLSRCTWEGLAPSWG